MPVRRLHDFDHSCLDSYPDLGLDRPGLDWLNATMKPITPTTLVMALIAAKKAA